MWPDYEGSLVMHELSAGSDDWSTPVSIAESPELGGGRISQDAHGHTLVVWSQFIPDSPQDRFWAQDSPAGSGEWTPPTLLPTGLLTGAGVVAIDQGPHGEAVVLFDPEADVEDAGEPLRALSALRRANALSEWGQPEVVLSDVEGSTNTQLSLVSLLDGRHLITYALAPGGSRFAYFDGSQWTEGGMPARVVGLEADRCGRAWALLSVSVDEGLDLQVTRFEQQSGTWTPAETLTEQPLMGLPEYDLFVAENGLGAVAWVEADAVQSGGVDAVGVTRLTAP